VAKVKKEKYFACGSPSIKPKQQHEAEDRSSNIRKAGFELKS